MTPTEEVDHTTEEERNDLMGFCETDYEWTRFTRGTDAEKCGICGGKFSMLHGFQLTSFRTFDPIKAKKESAKLRNKRNKK